MLLREYAKDLFLRTLARVDVVARMSAQLTCDRGVLRIGQLQYDLNDFGKIIIISAGKAAVPMADAVVSIVQHDSQPGPMLQGIVVCGAEPPNKIDNFHYYVAGHPIPNQESRNAAEAILDLLSRSDGSSLVLFLISGGASAMVEKPLNDSISVEETATFYRALVHSGLPITQMNCLRKHLSAVKGGRLAQIAEEATQCTLIVSDVPDGSLNMVGSGPSMPDSSTIEECHRILEDSKVIHTLPARVNNFLLAPDLPETAKPKETAFSRASYVCVLSNADLLQEAKALAESDGFHVIIDNSYDDRNFEETGAYLLDRVCALAAEHRKVCLLSGGEVSVRLPERVGRGGRNQQFALWCALRLQQTHDAVTVLSAGTDGIDGNSLATGAVVDNSTCEDAQQRGLDPAACFAGFDSFSLFNAIDATLMTGPTGNNVRDLRMLLADN